MIRKEFLANATTRPVLTGLVVALILGVAVFFRLYNLGGRDLWTDEAWVALAAMQPTAREALAARDSTPPLYLLTVWAAVQLWGHSEVVLRGLSWVFGMATLTIVWRLGRAWLAVTAALLALATVAWAPAMVYYSKELKQYSGDAAFAVLVVWLAERLITSQGRRGWLALALAGVLGLGFSQPLVFTLPVVGVVLWFLLPPEQRPRLAGIGAVWILTFGAYYLWFIRGTIDPELVQYWDRDFPDFSGVAPFCRWLGSAFYRYCRYFFGTPGLIWGPILLAGGMVVLVRRGCGRVLLYLGGPLLLALGAACLHRYPFMAHYGGNRLMLFSAPLLYLTVAAGGWGIFTWLWRRRQRWLALALTGVLLAALQPLAGIRENLYPKHNREEIQPLVRYLEANLHPGDLVYVYYFAVAPFKYYFQGPAGAICWGRSCVERGLDALGNDRPPPPRLWMIASHIPDLNFLRQFAANLLGKQWQEAACYTRAGAALLRFDRSPPDTGAAVLTVPPRSPESGDPDPSADKACKSGPAPPPP
jgi:4-amino-4-deoxy-L-arabinose transferase-like glycosyltransferase